MINRSLVTVAGAALTVLAAPVQAQSLAARVAAAGSETVTFHFTPRAGVCGDGEHFIRTGRSSYHGSFTAGRAEEPCIAGPVQVLLSFRDGGVDGVQEYAGPLRARNARDLGVVPAAEAADYLMGLAARGSGKASGKAILPAVLADSATVWPTLLAIVKDTATRSRATRQDALFWLSRFASGALVGRPNDPFLEHDGDDDLKRHAVFVLSQLPRKEGVPALLELARSNPDIGVRSAAMFWLGQSGDPRAIALFETALRR